MLVPHRRHPRPDRPRPRPVSTSSRLLTGQPKGKTAVSTSTNTVRAVVENHPQEVEDGKAPSHGTVDGGGRLGRCRRGKRRGGDCAPECSVATAGSSSAG